MYLGNPIPSSWKKIPNTGKTLFKKIKKANRKKPNGALFCAPLDLPVNAKTAPIKASLINSFTVKFQNNTIKTIFLLAFNK